MVIAGSGLTMKTAGNSWWKTSWKKQLQKDKSCVIHVQKRGSFYQALGSYGKRGIELQPVLQETVCICFREHQVLNPKFSRSRGSPSRVVQIKGTLAEPHTTWTIWEEDLRQSFELFHVGWLMQSKCHEIVIHFSKALNLIANNVLSWLPCRLQKRVARLLMLWYHPVAWFLAILIPRANQAA